MGQYFSRPPDFVAIGAPPLRTPLSDITAPIGHHDTPRCLHFNLRFVDCIDAYGHIKGKEKCSELYQDYMECAQNWKKLHRIQDMETERKRQWMRGMLGKGPKVPLYAENPPSKDSYAPDFCMEDP